MIIDCDPGVDDAMAIIAAARWADLVGITTVAGNVPLEHTTANACRLRSMLGLDVEVHAGADGPLVGEQAFARHVHGAGRVGPNQLGQFDGVGNQDVDQLEQVVWKGSGRRRVEDHRSGGHPGRSGDGLHRHLELQEEHRGIPECHLRIDDVLRTDATVGSRADHDGVVAVGIHADQGDPAGCVRVFPEERGVHARSV